MVEWKTLKEALSIPAWRDNYETSINLYAMYRAPGWLECFNQSHRELLSVAYTHDDDNPTFAVMSPHSTSLNFHISRSMGFALKIRVMELLGGDVIGEVKEDTIAEIINATWSKYRDINAIYLKSLSTDSDLWKSLEANHWRVDGASIYLPDGIRPFHYAALPSTYDEYMKGFGSKQRFTLRKKLRKINEAYPDKIEFLRLTEPDDMEYLTTSALKVIGNSWKAQGLGRVVLECIEDKDLLKNIASRGFLRSHVLTIDGIPRAFIVGYLYNGIYHYADLAYDSEFSNHSPGTVLLLSAIEDLIKKDHVKYINFGISDAQYKRVFGNCHIEDASVLIVRPTLSNLARISLHRTFRYIKALVKRLVEKK